MKSRKFEPIVYIVGLIALFLLPGCDKENEQDPEIPPTNGDIPVKQVDMKVVIPIHPSSLEYFDYMVSYTDNSGEEYCDTIAERKGGLTVDDWIFDYVGRYTDNSGEEYCDTIAERKGGITVEDWMDQEYEALRDKSRASQDCDIYYVKNFAYKELPVACRCEVTMVPKVSRDSIVSFSYTIPKPYIFSRVIFDSHSYTPQMGNNEIEGTEILKFDSIRIGTFLSAYGTWFCSTCSVKSDYDGISASFY